MAACSPSNDEAPRNIIRLEIGLGRVWVSKEDRGIFHINDGFFLGTIRVGDIEPPVSSEEFKKRRGQRRHKRHSYHYTIPKINNNTNRTLLYNKTNCQKRQIYGRSYWKYSSPSH